MCVWPLPNVIKLFCPPIYFWYNRVDVLIVSGKQLYPSPTVVVKARKHNKERGYHKLIHHSRSHFTRKIRPEQSRLAYWVELWKFYSTGLRFKTVIFQSQKFFWKVPPSFRSVFWCQKYGTIFVLGFYSRIFFPPFWRKKVFPSFPVKSEKVFIVLNNSPFRKAQTVAINVALQR